MTDTVKDLVIQNADRIKRLEDSIITLNHEMGEVQALLTGIDKQMTVLVENTDKRLNDIRWLVGGVGLPVVVAAIKVIISG